MTDAPDLNAPIADTKDGTLGPPGGEVLDKLTEALKKYVVFPSDAALYAAALWTAATHAQVSWNNAPRLGISSPEKRCGKSRLLEVVLCLSHEPKMTSNVTTAALFRIIEMQKDTPPTILIDESDAIFGSKAKADLNEDLRSLINSGYSRHLPSIRCVGPQQVPTEFRNYAMLAAAGIGQLPDTITDRAVNIALRRRMMGETVQPFRMYRDGPPLHGIRDELAAWLGPKVDDLRAADPATPLEDRAADNWAPLLAIADLAGGEWPERARLAAKVLTAEHDKRDATQSLNIQLLRDVAAIWKATPDSFISSKALATQLRSDQDLPWGDMDLTPRRLAMRLAPFGIVPGHNHAKTERGYLREAFTDAIARYISPDSGES